MDCFVLAAENTQRPEVQQWLKELLKNQGGWICANNECNKEHSKGDALQARRCFGMQEFEFFCGNKVEEWNESDPQRKIGECAKKYLDDYARRKAQETQSQSEEGSGSSQ